MEKLFKRKIIIHENSTTFYFPKEEKKELRNELNKMPILIDYKLEWITNRFLFKYPLTEIIKSNILNSFEVPEVSEVSEVPENIKVIRGHSGCLITGYALRWK